jgi:hypothetical protein
MTFWRVAKPLVSTTSHYAILLFNFKICEFRSSPTKRNEFNLQIKMKTKMNGWLPPTTIA